MKRILLIPVLFAAVLLTAAVEPADRKYVAKDGSFVREIKPAELFCSIPFKIDVKAEPGMALVFDCKVASPVPVYVAVNMRGTTPRVTYCQTDPSSNWRTVVMPLDSMFFAEKGNPKVKAGDRFTSMTIYARNSQNKKSDGVIRIELKNVRFEVQKPKTPAAAVKLPELPTFKMPYTAGKVNFAASLQNGATLKDGVFSLTEKVPSNYTSLGFALNVPCRRNIICSFEYRLKTNGATVDYIGVNFFRKSFGTFHSFNCQTEWTAASIRFSALPKELKESDILNHMAIYAKCEKTPGKPTLEVRNLRFEVDPDYDPLSGIRVSYSAYPVFDWPQEKGAEKYLLQYQGKSAEVKGLFYVPEDPVKAGLVKYTVTALPSGKVVRTDALFVPERNIRWKMPECDFKAFAAQPHPRLKELAAFLYPNREFMMNLSREFIAQPVPPDPQPYKAGAIPGVRAWIEWLGKIADGVISRHGYRMRALASAAMVTGDPELKLEAKKKLLAVLKWDPVNGGSNMKHADLQAAWLLRGIVFCYDAAYDILSEEERAEARRIIRIRGDQFWAHVHPCNLNDAQNHSWDQTEAAAFAALALIDEPGMADRFRFAAYLFAYRFFPALGFEGENNEGLEYWSYGGSLAVRFVEVAKYTIHLDLYQQPWLRQTARFPMYCNPPKGYSVAFADNGRPNHGRIGPMSPKLAAKWGSDAGDGMALWYAGYPEAKGVTAKIPLDVSQSKAYTHIGWAVFNTFLPDGRENVAVGFHSGKYFAGHQHADQNSFVINAYGDMLAIDGGYYDWWGSPHFYGYSITTAAHNTILADGKGQDFHTPGSDGKFKHYFDAPSFGYVAGDAAKVYQKRVSQFDRDLLFVKPDYVFVYDRLAAPKPTVFSWLMHSHTDQPIAAEKGDFAIARPLAGLTGSILRPAALTTKVGPAYTIMPGNGYSIDPVPNRQKEWCFTASNAEPVSNTEFLAAMRIQRGPGAKVEQNWTTEENDDALLVSGKDVEVLFNRHPGKMVKLGKFVTDARCAAVILKDGNVEDFVKIGGKSMRYGKVTCDRPGDCAKVMKREMQRGTAEIRFCGSSAELRTYTITYPFDRKIHVKEGLLDIPEAGDYELVAATPGNYIAAQGEKADYIDITNSENMRFYGRTEPGNPVRLTLKKGRMIFCVSADQPIGELEWRKVK